MPEPRPTAVLKLEPHTIPQLKAAFMEAVEMLAPKLADLWAQGRIGEPWMHDPVSMKIAESYNEHVMDGPDSAYAQLKAYERELIKVVDTLTALEEQYRRTEGENSDLWGRFA